MRSGSAVSAADSEQPRARMRHSTGSPGMMHRVRASKSASVLSTQPDGSCAHGGKSMRPPPWDIAVQRRWFRLQRKSYSAGSTLGEPLAALASSRPIMFARTSQPSAAVRSLLSWRGWRSASAIFCSARSRHSAAVSMAFLGGPRRGASKQKAPNASVQNRTPRKKRPRRSGVGDRYEGFWQESIPAVPPTHGGGVGSDAKKPRPM